MDENIRLLITIIAYLLLAFAFFSGPFSKKDKKYTHELWVFIFGIFALIFLFLSFVTENFIWECFGYGLTVSFISVFLFLLLNTLCISFLNSSLLELFKHKNKDKNIFTLLKSKVLISALLIFMLSTIFLLLLPEMMA